MDYKLQGSCLTSRIVECSLNRAWNFSENSLKAEEIAQDKA